MSTPTECLVCMTSIDRCTCPDIDDRLRTSVMDPDGVVLFKWCKGCDKHYARCTCQTPQFRIISGGKEVELSTLRDVLGRRPNVDLSPNSEK